MLRLAYAALKLKWRLLRPISIGVRMVVLRDGAVLLVRHTYQSGWFLPGGGLNRGETPREAAEREAYEEAGVRCRTPARLVDLASSFIGGKSDHVAIFLTTDFEVTEPPDRWEIAEVKWFDLNELPDDLHENTRRRILAIAWAAQAGAKLP